MKIEKVDCEIEKLIAYYFLDEQSYPVGSIDLAVDTALAHPELDYHIPGNSLDTLHADVKKVTTLVILLIKRGHLKKSLYLAQTRPWK